MKINILNCNTSHSKQLTKSPSRALSKSYMRFITLGALTVIPFFSIAADNYAPQSAMKLSSIQYASMTHNHMKHGKNGNIEERVGRMIEQLELTVEQQAQVHAILTQGKADAKAKRDVLRELKSQIIALEPEQGDFRNKVEALLDKKQAIKEDMKEHRQAKMKAVRDVLTDEQLDTMLDRKMQHRGKLQKRG